MKVGNVTRSTINPQPFTARLLFDKLYELEHCDDVHTVDVIDYTPEGEKTTKQYEYTRYFETKQIDNYDDLVSKLVGLKYSNGDEIALMRKGIEDPTSHEYEAYLSYVTACKTFAQPFKTE